MIEKARDMIEQERRFGRATVAYLRADVTTLTRRLLAGPGDRPSLTGADIVEEIQVIVARRSATYEALADLIVDASAAAGEVVQTVSRWAEQA
jgi:shikimate kinase